MKVIIAGSRHMPFSAYPLIQQAIDASGFQVDEVVCGMAKGADTFGMKWAYHAGIPVKKFPADWETHGKAAGPIRNSEMRDYADALIVFIWDGSRGSANMLAQMEKVGKPCYVVYNGVING
jgi:hypothetical protein